MGLLYKYWTHIFPDNPSI